MDKIADFMGKDHDRLDGIFKEFQTIKQSNLTGAKRLFADFKAGLERHIIWEEDILFPMFETRTGMYDSGPTAVMRMEHRQIKGFLAQIQDAISSGNTKTEEFENGLSEVLTAHNNKEESILYPWIDDSISEDERQQSLLRMKNLPSVG